MIAMQLLKILDLSLKFFFFFFCIALGKYPSFNILANQFYHMAQRLLVTGLWLYFQI